MHIKAWFSRLSTSPWWPLAVWLGLPVGLSNLAIFGWSSLHSHVALSAYQASTTPSTLLLEVLQFVSLFAPMLIGTQLMVASLVLCCGPARFGWRLLEFGIAFGPIVVTAVGGVAAAYVVDNCLAAWRNGTWVVADVHLTEFDGPDLLQVAATVPMLLLGFQAPFWLLRSIPGWTLQRRESSTAASPISETFSIRHLLLATTLVAVSLALRHQPGNWTDALVRYSWGHRVSRGAGNVRRSAADRAVSTQPDISNTLGIRLAIVHRSIRPHPAVVR